MSREPDDRDLDTDEIAVVSTGTASPPAVFGRRARRMAARRRSRRLRWFVAVVVLGVLFALFLARPSGASLVRSGPQVGTIQESREPANEPQKETV